MTNIEKVALLFMMDVDISLDNSLTEQLEKLKEWDDKEKMSKVIDTISDHYHYLFLLI